MAIRLTPDQETLVQHAVAQGLAPSAEAFVADALREKVEKAAFESWVKNEVIPGHGEYLADLATGKSVEEARRELFGNTTSPAAKSLDEERIKRGIADMEAGRRIVSLGKGATPPFFPHPPEVLL